MDNQEKLSTDNIEEILRKYFDGKTSVEEERLLKDYYARDKNSDSSSVDQSLFLFLNQDTNSFVNNDLLWTSIREEEKKHQNRKKIIYQITSIAASVIIVLSIGLWYNVSFQNKQKITADTYNNPEIAYRVAQKYLGMVSRNLTIAYAEIKPIEKFSIPLEAVKSFRSINSNFEYLNQFDKLGESSRKIEKFSEIDSYIKLNDSSQTIK